LKSGKGLRSATRSSGLTRGHALPAFHFRKFCSLFKTLPQRLISGVFCLIGKLPKGRVLSPKAPPEHGGLGQAALPKPFPAISGGTRAAAMVGRTLRLSRHLFGSARGLALPPVRSDNLLCSSVVSTFPQSPFHLSRPSSIPPSVWLQPAIPNVKTSFARLIGIT